MTEVGIKTLKNRLSEYLRLAASGETVLVTDRGQVVAELIAPRVRAGAPAAEQILGELTRQGLLTPAQVSARARLPQRKPLTVLADVLHDLDAGRTER